MAIQTELGYTYTAFKKTWGFKRAFDTDLVNYAAEQQIIHDLKAVYLSLPLRGSMQYKKLKGTLGISVSRVFSATADRNFRNRGGIPLEEWIDNKGHWRSTKKTGSEIELNVPYLSHYFTWQGMMGLEYQLNKNIFVGLELRRFYDSPTLDVQLQANGEDGRSFFYKGDMLSLSFVYLH